MGQTMNDIMASYGITEKHCELLSSAYEVFYAQNNIDLQFRDSREVKEFPDQSDFETGTSDGKSIILHDNVEDIGGFATRLYDMYHLIGHYVQWNYTGNDSKIEFLGDYGWDVATRDFTQPEHDTELALRYEIEAAKIGVGFLDEAIALIPDSEMTADQKANVRQFVVDFQNTDKEVLKALYNDGEEKEHAELWLNNTSLEPIHIDLQNETVPNQRDTENLAIIPVLHFDGKINKTGEAKAIDANGNELGKDGNAVGDVTSATAR